MGKIPRYFDKLPEENEKDVIVFNVISKPHKWGRHQEDKRLNNIKKKNYKEQFKKNNCKKIKFNIPKEKLKKYKRNSSINESSIKTTIHKKKIQNKEKNINFAIEQAATSEILLTESSGYLERGDGETTTQFTQKQIAINTNIQSAAKSFDLQLNNFGPYRAKYTRNGRHLLLGGHKGHIAAFDWITKKLHCEINVMESIHDICWLHIETMFAVAQKKWVYIYDNQGIELHCLKKLNNVTRMEFLPYHFLLASCSEEGYLSWLDISIGQLISQYNTKLGRLTMLTQNPWNALLCLGHSKGTVSLWSPNAREPLAKILCHNAPLSALDIESRGMYMATSSVNRELKIWDIRKLRGPLQEYKLLSPCNNLSFSQTNMLGIGMGNIVEIYNDCCLKATKHSYMRYKFRTSIGNFKFCPYEDILGVATGKGFTSLLIPGSGEANFDALEANPFQSKSQRRENEVKSLLEKIQPDLISLNPTIITEVDVSTLKNKIETTKKLMHVKPLKINYGSKKKMKNRESIRLKECKNISQDKNKEKFLKGNENTKNVSSDEGKNNYHVLNRFICKK